MKKYRVTQIVKISYIYYVEANSKKEAVEKAQERGVTYADTDRQSDDKYNVTIDSQPEVK